MLRLPLRDRVEIGSELECMRTNGRKSISLRMICMRCLQTQRDSIGKCFRGSTVVEGWESCCMSQQKEPVA